MRPEYTAEELDEQCEILISDLLARKYGQTSFPLPTDDLRMLLEAEAETLTLDSDLHEPRDIEARIEFRRGQRPAVQIASNLARSPHLKNRFRTVLAHLYGHVHFHDFLFQTEEGLWLSLFEDPPDNFPRFHRCRRDSIAPLAEEDWMEWQAGYVAGALLMPRASLIDLVREFRHARDLDHAALSERALDGVALIREVAIRFQTSWDAARIRLIQTRVLAPADTRSLF